MFASKRTMYLLELMVLTKYQNAFDKITAIVGALSHCCLSRNCANRAFEAWTIRDDVT